MLASCFCSPKLRFRHENMLNTVSATIFSYWRPGNCSQSFVATDGHDAALKLKSAEVCAGSIVRDKSKCDIITILEYLLIL